MSAALKLDDLSPALDRDAAGIWTVRGPRDAVSFPESGYDSCFGFEDGSFWFQHRTEAIHRMLGREWFRGPILDIGGGNGAVSAGLEKRGRSAVMLEPGAQGARNARKRGVANVVCATLEGAGFREGAFEAAGMFDVLEHIEDDVGMLRSVRRVLGGPKLLCLTVPAYQTLWSNEDVLAGHFRRYSPRTLGGALETAGYSVLHKSFLFAPLVAPMLLVRGLRRSKNIAESQKAAVSQHMPSPLVRRVADLALAPELWLISRGLSVPTGTTLLMLARVEGKP